MRLSSPGCPNCRVHRRGLADSGTATANCPGTEAPSCSCWSERKHSDNSAADTNLAPSGSMCAKQTTGSALVYATCKVPGADVEPHQHTHRQKPPQYLNAVASCFSSRWPPPSLHCADLSEPCIAEGCAQVLHEMTSQSNMQGMGWALNVDFTNANTSAPQAGHNDRSSHIPHHTTL